MHRSPYERRRPWIVALVGYPGFGKTTQALILANALGLPRLRLGRSLKDRGFVKTPEEAETPRLWYDRLLGYTDVYLKEIVEPKVREHGVAVLDGFPRHRQEFDGLQALVTKNDWALTIIHFDLPTDQERRAFSVARQRERAVTLGRPVNDAWYEGKVGLAHDFELVAITEARALGARVVTIDPRIPLESVSREVRTALRLDFERLPWDHDALRILHEVAPEAYLVGSSFYQPFFDGIFGPMQMPWHLSVAVETDERVAEVENLLARRAPQYHWRIGNAVSFMREKTGITVGRLREALALSHNLVGLSGGVRLISPGHLDVVFGPNAEAHLRRGILEPSVHADREEARRKTTRLIRDYPGLSAPWVKHEPAEVIPDWATIHAQTIATESGGRRVWGVLTEEEERIADELRKWARDADKHCQRPPMLPRQAPAPASHWSAKDSEFREWLVQKLTALIESSAGIDRLLERALETQRGVSQKPTHQGWSTDQHAVHTLLQLETDHLPPSCRRALRVAALFHDLGKKWNVWTPGAHALIGARNWLTFAPEWLSHEEQKLVTFLVANHDILGRLARGVKELGYQGARDPQTVRLLIRESGYPPPEALDMLLALNRADIGSVAALRWTLPELEYAAAMVASGL